MRILSVCAFVLVAFASAVGFAAEKKHDARWIWYDAGNPAQSAPAGKVWFRREIRASEPSTGAVLVLCDDRFTLWVNGRKIGSGTAGKPYRFNLNGVVDRGPNVFAVEAENLEGKAGLYVDGEIRGQGGHPISFDTGSEWLATLTPPRGPAWLAPDFDASAWKAVRVIGRHEDSPWKSVVLKETYLDRFVVPEEFELVRVAEPKMVGSLVAMTWGNRGRLMVSRERGAIEALIDDNDDGIYDRVVEYSTDVKNCQGLCTVGDDLYAVGSGPKGVGVYRLPDKNHDDKADEVQFLVHHQGGMGDHGPHDVVFGPDGWLYHNLGNHAHVTQKAEPTSACRNFDEDYLLVPKFEDAGGHAVGIKAPGGTIWRFTPDGKHWWLETNGFRNEYDFAFNEAGDLFTFDADMEWDVGAYWYRPVRVNHCTAGAEFGWRSGAAKWPAYYFDSLPGAVDVGRGSPTGVIFYDHTQLPERFRGAFICCDWSLGRLLAFHLTKSGATYTGNYETILSGNPLNVTDVEVDRDGSILFTTGGRATEGGVYRLRHKGGHPHAAGAATVAELLTLPQIESAWAREIAAGVKAAAGPKWQTELTAAARSENPHAQLRALTLLCQLGPKPELELLVSVANSKDAAVRAFATHLLGFHTGDQVRAALAQLLGDRDLTVQRRACEAFVRSGIEPPVEPMLTLLASDDRWLRFAARVALERVPQAKWFQKALASSDLHVLTEALLADYRHDRKASATRILEHTSKLLTGARGPISHEIKLAALRLTELALLEGLRNADSSRIGSTLFAEFPTHKIDVDAETARILVVLNLDGAVAKIMPLVEHAETHGEQLHFALTLRYVNAGWNFDLRRRLMEWYEGTPGWEGGNSLTGYVRNVVSAIIERFSPEDRSYFLRNWRKHPAGAALIVRLSQPEQIANFDQVISGLLEAGATPATARQQEIIDAAVHSLAKKKTTAARSVLYKLYEEHPDHREAIARAIADEPVAEDEPLLIRTLQFADATTVQLCLTALGDLSLHPKEAEPYLRVLQTAQRLGSGGGMGAVRLLHTWSGVDYNTERKLGVRRPGRHKSLGDAELDNSVDTAITFYKKWYHDKFPSAPPPELPKADLSKSKYTFQQIAELVEHDGKGSVERGRLIFTKAKCVKCHKFQAEGEGVGPDLTSVRRRFQRKEIVESIVYPSQVISDQYRMVQVETKEGQVYVGMPIPGVSKNDKLTLLLSDTTRLEIPKSRIEEQTASKISVMPAGLLDPLSLQEVADLLAFLETSKFNAPVSKTPATKTPITKAAKN
jgi:putative heme-binding domain-containing protein